MPFHANNRLRQNQLVPNIMKENECTSLVESVCAVMEGEHGENGRSIKKSGHEATFIICFGFIREALLNTQTRNQVRISVSKPKWLSTASPFPHISFDFQSFTVWVSANYFYFIFLLMVSVPFNQINANMWGNIFRTDLVFVLRTYLCDPKHFK